MMTFVINEALSMVDVPSAGTDFCDIVLQLIVDHFVQKEFATAMKECKEATSVIPLGSHLCSAVESGVETLTIDVARLLFDPICNFIVHEVQEITGFSLNDWVQTLEGDEQNEVDKWSTALCGQTICSGSASESTLCKLSHDVNTSKPIKFIESATSAEYCKIASAARTAAHGLALLVAVSMAVWLVVAA